MIAGKPELFRGPLEHNGRQINMFEQIIEARYIRFEPQTWKHAIALKFDLFSCDIVISTPRPGLKTTTPRALVPVDECRDQMGLENNEIKDHQITFSSVDGHFKSIRLGSDNAWRPSINSRKEFVRVDLLEPRNISGLVTQGGYVKGGHAKGHTKGGAWVESYM